jgi:hypothetical protein
VGRVLRGAPQPLGLLCAGVALDRVQGQAQAAGAFQQAGALAEQVMDLLPSFQGGLGALPALRRGCPGDEVYGGRQLRRGIRQRAMGYVMAVRANHAVTTGPAAPWPPPAPPR